mmetsp:Transcript_32577/g.49287  ORF Transcript_32577/g.49287 Transcript_32577/m.49287 type:complete len:85 (-) Transcript_32577:425-679(-)
MRGMNIFCICAISFELLRIWQDESFLLSQPGFIKPTHVTKAYLAATFSGVFIENMQLMLQFFFLLGVDYVYHFRVLCSAKKYTR